jgi:DNA-binding MarR family transcriptional regulator
LTTTPHSVNRARSATRAPSPRRRIAGDRATGARARATTATVDAIRRLVRALRLAARRTEGGSGLSPAQLFVLTQLADGAPASLSELAERTLTDRSSVAAVVERLAARGLVVRARSTEDRRRAAVHLTAAGRALLRRAPKAPAALLLEAIGALGQRELAQLAAALTRLTEHLGVASEPATMLFEDEGGDAARRGAAGRARPRPKREAA